MSVLIDTNIVSELRKAARANPGVKSWSQSLLEGQVFISVITLHEIARGIVAAEKRRRPEAALLRDWFDTSLRPGYANRMLPVTAEIALVAASFAAERTVELADHLIAATAIVHDLTLVTRNTGHFTHTGVRLLSPFT